MPNNLDKVRASKVSPKILLSLHGGSFMYGLEVPSSDIDLRGTFAGEVESIFVNDGDRDSLFMRIDRFLESAACSTQTMEMLFAPKRAIKYVNPAFRSLVMDHANKFIDTALIVEKYENLIDKQVDIFTGSNLPKKADGKNRLLFNKYGFVPKGFAHALRAAMSMTEFLGTGAKQYPTDFAALFPDTAKLIRKVKSQPETFKQSDLLPRLQAAVAAFKEAKEQYTNHTLPDEKYRADVAKTLSK